MAKKYIQNCTGDDCGKNAGSDRKGSVASLLSRIIFYILLIGFFSVSAYVLFFSPYLKILNIEINGTREINSEEIKQKVEKSLAENFLGIIPKNNFLFISQKTIEPLLKNDFKKIRTVVVTKKFPNSVVVNIDERKALLVWCSGEVCYLLDENGVAYNKAEFNSQEFIQNNLLQIRDLSGREIIIGEEVVAPSYEKLVLDIGDALANIGLNVDGEYSTPSRMADEIHIKTSQGLMLYFSTQVSLSSSIFTLDTILKKEIPVEKLGDVEYIDLRNENKVFYKFKSAPKEITNETSDAVEKK